MDTLTKAKKIQAMNSYKAQLLQMFDLLIIIAMTCSLISFYHYWFPSLYSPIKEFLFISLPNAYSFIFSPKCLFLVVNVIVAFLVGESKLGGSNSACPADEIYDEYVERSRRFRGISSTTLQEKAVQSKVEMKLLAEEKRVSTIKVQEEAVMKEQVKGDIESSTEEQEEEFQEVQEEADEVLEEDQESELVQETQAQEEGEVKQVAVEEETNWPAEELNRRVEEFIARVNRQRWLEEVRLLEPRLLVSCTA